MDKVDVIHIDVPLFIRLLEYAREDAKNDMELHRLTEKVIRLSKRGTVSMKQYNQLFKTTVKEDCEEMKDFAKPSGGSTYGNEINRSDLLVAVVQAYRLAKSDNFNLLPLEDKMDLLKTVSSNLNFLISHGFEEEIEAIVKSLYTHPSEYEDRAALNFKEHKGKGSDVDMSKYNEISGEPKQVNSGDVFKMGGIKESLEGQADQETMQKAKAIIGTINASPNKKQEFANWAKGARDANLKELIRAKLFGDAEKEKVDYRKGEV